MSADGRRAELVEALRPKLGLRQHMAEPLADALLPLVQKIEAGLSAKDARIAELEAELKDASNAYWREREQLEADRLVKDTEIGRLRRELAEANRRYEERTPTQWAYEQACHALEKHRGRADAAEAEVERLRASEEDDRPKDPGAWPTPGQWIYRWNRMAAERRLETATQAIVNAQEADECFRMDHKASLDEADTQRTVLAERAYTAEAQGDRARAERDELAVTVEQVRAALAKWEEDTVHDADALGFLLDDLRAALCQASGESPAEERCPIDGAHHRHTWSLDDVGKVCPGEPFLVASPAAKPDGGGR